MPTPTFEPGDRVAIYFGPNDQLGMYLVGDTGPSRWRMTGTVVRPLGNLVMVEIDDSASQDSEGHNAIGKYHRKQLRRLKAKKSS